MKDLILLYNRTTSVKQKNIRQLRLNCEKSGIVYVSTNEGVISFDWSTNEVNEIAPIENVIAIEHLSLNDELCIATEAGEVLVYNMHSANEESVTFCAGGIETMAWSHDQEVVAFVTKTNSLVVMNSAYDVLNECQLDNEDFGTEQFVNVGWGKKETQFHGSEGKSAAKQKPEEVVITDPNDLDRRISIVWRGDDELFVVSFVGKWGRMFKVYDKEGKLKYTSEKCAGLESALAWRPSGAWIAIPQLLPNKYTVALFEKNGLRHREIVLPFKHDAEQVTQLAWSSDSDVLAIHTVQGESSNIYLYTICNYHWYLKQTLNFNGKCKTLLWDTNHSEGKTLHVIQDNGTYSLYRWEHSVHHSHGFSNLDQAIVGVIDQCNLLLTNFRGAVVPPPMSSSTLCHSKAINYVSFLQYEREASHSNRFLVVDASNTVNVFECQFDCNTERNSNLLKDTKLIGTYNFSINTDVPLFQYHWTWLNEEIVVVCHNRGNASLLLLCELNSALNALTVLDELEIDGIVGNVTGGGDAYSVVYHLLSGEFYTIQFDAKKWQSPEHKFTLDGFCEQVGCTSGNEEPKIVSLKNQSLYIDDRRVTTDATSFLITDKFIMFTTLDRLKFIRLENEQIINDRRIERGGKLVITVPHDSRTVLQMPRGNLETIQPRILSLCIVGELLDGGHYNKAFDLLRKQRINLNLLVDHNPAQFLEDIPKFVADIDNVQWLNLFLTDLQNEDVTRSVFAGNYLHLENRPKACFENDDKINAVCKQMCAQFENDPTGKYLLPKITTYVKCKDLETALNIVWSVRLEEIKQSNANATAVVSSHEALKYLLYLVNVNELYDVALGMYDFDLVLFVAQKSHKDPKEYLPFLNELKGFEENYRKYKIDNHLKRYSKALMHIVKCGVEKVEECLELIEKQNLYTEALRLFKNTDECYSDIVLHFADHLRSKGVFYEACVMYERGGDLKQALLTAKHTLDWRKCYLLAKKCAHSEEEIQQICLSMLPSLESNHMYKQAADLVKHFGEDKKLLIRLLCDAKSYQEAIFEAKISSESLNDLIREIIGSGAEQVITKTRADIGQFVSYTQRLAHIRKEKAEKQLNGIEDDVNDCDLFSDTSSMNSSRFTGTSKGSGKSHRSSKNRRKHERKLLSLKEGNPFEDLALIDAIYNLAQKSYAQQQQVHDLLQALIDLQLDNEGIQLQQTFEELLTVIKDSLDSVWLPEMMVPGELKVEEVMDYAQSQTNQHYAMIKPHQRAKPLLPVIDWQFEILKSKRRS